MEVHHDNLEYNQSNRSFLPQRTKFLSIILIVNLAIGFITAFVGLTNLNVPTTGLDILIGELIVFIFNIVVSILIN